MAPWPLALEALPHYHDIFYWTWLWGEHSQIKLLRVCHTNMWKRTYLFRSPQNFPWISPKQGVHHNTAQLQGVDNDKAMLDDIYLCTHVTSTIPTTATDAVLTTKPQQAGVDDLNYCGLPNVSPQLFTSISHYGFNVKAPVYHQMPLKNQYTVVLSQQLYFKLSKPVGYDMAFTDLGSATCFCNHKTEMIWSILRMVPTFLFYFWSRILHVFTHNKSSNMKGLGPGTSETKISTHLKLLEPWQIIGVRKEKTKTSIPWGHDDSDIMQILC